jgi:capsular polysaccharide biosynthesis protein
MRDPSNDERPGPWLAALRRRWSVVLATALLVGALVAVFALQRSRTYLASTTVFVRPLVGNAFTAEALTNSQVTTSALNTEASLVDSRGVTDRVNAALGTHLSPGTSHVHARVPGDTQLVQIEVRADSAVQARRYASAYASAFLDYRTSLARDNQSAQLERLDAQAVAAHKRLERAAAAANLPSPAPSAAAELQLASAQVAAIETAVGQVEALDIEPGGIVRPAHVASASFFDSPGVLIAGGVLFGLLLGFVLAVWREVRDDRIRASELASIEGVPVLAVVPADQPAPAIRRLRTGVIATLPDGAVLGVTPLAASDSAIAAGLAVALARSLAAAGCRILLVDAALDAPRIGPLLDMTTDTGLSDLLVTPSGHAEPVQLGGIRVLPAGSHIDEARERYGGEAIAAVLRALRAEGDYVLLLTPPLDSGDGAAVLQAVNRPLIVATEAVSRRAQVRQAAQLADRLARPPVGLVAVAADWAPPPAERRPEQIRSAAGESATVAVVDGFDTHTHDRKRPAPRTTTTSTGSKNPSDASDGSSL